MTSKTSAVIEKQLLDISGLSDIDFEVVSKKIDDYTKAVSAIIKLLQLYSCKNGLLRSGGVVDAKNVDNEVAFIDDLVANGNDLLKCLDAFTKITISGVTYKQFEENVKASYEKIRKHTFTSVIYTIYRNFVQIFSDNELTVPEDLTTAFDCKKFAYLSETANANFNPLQGIRAKAVVSNGDKTIESTANFSRLWLPIVDVVNKKALESFREVGQLILERMFSYSRIYYETMCMLDVSVEQFTTTLLDCITQLKSSIPSTGQKLTVLFDTLTKSTKIFSANAHKYYRKYIITGAEGVVMYSYISDVSEHFKASGKNSQIMLQANKLLRLLQDNVNVNSNSVIKHMVANGINQSAGFSGLTSTTSNNQQDIFDGALKYTPPTAEKKAP
jgi:hypothetical protein